MKNLFALLVLVFPLGSILGMDQPNIIIFYTDDWGYGDIGINKSMADVRTPNLDRLAAEGALLKDGYASAPQCAPSRAGLLTGRYQQRFNFDSIPDGPLPLEEVTIADRLKKAGYLTGMLGKWHLEPNQICLKWAQKQFPGQIRNEQVKVTHEMVLPFLPGARGFDEFYQGELKSYWRNYGLDGGDLKPERVKDERFRVDVQNEAALAFIRRHAGGKKPFFLYVAHYAPHVPLEATEKYLARFPGPMPERRRTALAMMSAVDDGVGQVMKLLDERDLRSNTLIFFASDNGAPLGAHQGEPKADVLPVEKAGAAWDGSSNDPLTGEKGMLAEGGIRVPMIISWPRHVRKGSVIDEPVINLDFAATAIAAAGLPADPALDGVNLLPFLSGSKPALPLRNLYWRFWNQAAVRAGDWKYLTHGDGTEMLFNLRADKEEKHNLISVNPERAAGLKQRLTSWTKELRPTGMPAPPLDAQETSWYRHYFEK